MEHSFVVKQKSLELPLPVVSLTDLNRLQRELEAIDVFLIQAAVRKSGESMALPRTTRNLDNIVQLNKLNLLVKEDRVKLGEFIKSVRLNAPKVHISFASDPSAAFIQKIAAWFRTNAHPLTILQIGLQPTIAAGCIVRTTNSYFDLSIRKDFQKKRQLLVETVRKVRIADQARVVPVLEAEPMLSGVQTNG